MIEKIKNFMKDEEGATAIEYAIMVAAIAAVIITTVVSLGNKTNTTFSNVDSKMPVTGGAGS